MNINKKEMVQENEDWIKMKANQIRAKSGGVKLLEN